MMSDEQVLEERRETSLSGPVWLFIISGGVTLASGALLTYYSVNPEAGGGTVGATQALGFLGVLAGVGVGVPASILLPIQLRQRARLDEEIEYRKTFSAPSAWRLSPSLTPTSLALEVGYSF